jgi:hypothetical protein
VPRACSGEVKSVSISTIIESLSFLPKTSQTNISDMGFSTSALYP